MYLVQMQTALFSLISFMNGSSLSNSRMTKVAVVTGSNKGIGYAIVKGLCEKFDGDVYLTARDSERGLAAIKCLNELGYQPKFFELDITVPTSVRKLRDHILKIYGGLDVLVNNAGVVYDWMSSPEPFGFIARETIRVNYFGFRDACDILFPILKPHARVVNLTSRWGLLSRLPGQHLRDAFAWPDLTTEQLNSLIFSFLNAAENGTHVREGWSQFAYAVSKMGVSALTRIQQRELLKEDESRPDILVNHVHPGHVRTDMTSSKAPLTIEQGAEAPIYLALLPENCTSPRGDFVWYTKQIINWVKDSDLTPT